jgi:hypothetical protein
MATMTATQDTAMEKPTSNASALSAASGLVWMRKPRAMPVPSSSAIAHACLTASATIRPASGDQRAIGSDRNRSSAVVDPYRFTNPSARMA